jgi:hypothetical protein
MGFMKIISPLPVFLTAKPWSLSTLEPSGHCQIQAMLSRTHLRWALIPVKPSPQSSTDHVNINVTHTRIDRQVKRAKK